ncbi:hypothetical protein FPRO05_11091 [Fusarium proliferatum]|uniref:Uncharacterized protein n=1 Tax=Gibberella intermedia TaxID=948311 RepID=A0A365NBA2_GIBIN|nr:hypothetical protein FPRO05_11091 [Fusarium proliferatum]
MNRSSQYPFDTRPSGFRHHFLPPPYTSRRFATRHYRSSSCPVTEAEIYQDSIQQTRLSNQVLSAGNMSAPSAPGPDETNHYYYGLPSRPRLVARTNFADEWKNIKGVEYAPKKVLGTVGRHPIAGLWNDSTGLLRRSIIEALIGLDWSAIDILRVGSETDELKTCPVVFFISVRPHSTSFATGYAIASRCLEILRSHSIDDVHVEMKESDVQRSASIPQQAPIDSPKLSSGPLTVYSNAEALWSDFLGVSIANLKEPYRSGTKCVYLRQKNTENVFALTCRHVVLSLEGAEYNFEDNDRDSPSEPIIQPGDRALNHQKTLVSGQIENIESMVKSVNNSLKLSPNEKQHQTDVLRSKLPRWKEAKRHLEALTEPAARIIGHVFYSPHHAGSTANSGAPRLRDWALIQLHQNKHSTPLAHLQNRMRVGRTDEFHDKLSNAAAVEKMPSYPQLPLDPGRETASLLQQTIPEEEMFSPREEAASLDDPAILVFLYGASSELSIGLANKVKSVLREPADNFSYLTEEWCIIGQRFRNDAYRVPFSAKGDSGSCLVDNLGRVGGVLTGGGGLHDGFDVSYAAPMVWILKDIASCKFDVELL